MIGLLCFATTGCMHWAHPASTYTSGPPQPASRAAQLKTHLDSVCKEIDQGNMKRVLFMCRCGVNRSALALIYYCCSSTKGLPWRQVHEAIVTAKGAAKASWSTLTNDKL